MHSQRRGSRNIEHISSTHLDANLKLLKAVARQGTSGGQIEARSAPAEQPAERWVGVADHASTDGAPPLDPLGRAYDTFGFQGPC